MKTTLTVLVMLCIGQIFAQDPADCINALTLCGTGYVLEAQPDGQGEIDEFSIIENGLPRCTKLHDDIYGELTPTIWIKINIENDGMLAFDIIPENIDDDYDFAIYGPTESCTSLGPAIRCSGYVHNAGQSNYTGLDELELDVFEGYDGTGNGYLKPIQVTAGETYYLFLNVIIGKGPFMMYISGDDVLTPAPTANDINDFTSCEMDDNPNGFHDLDLSQYIPEIIQEQENVSVAFFETYNDAVANRNPLPKFYNTYENPQTIYYRISNNESDCFDINNFDVEVENPFELNLPQNLSLCNNNTTPLTLSVPPNLGYYVWNTGEEGKDLNAINISYPGVYSVTVTSPEGCSVYDTTTVDGVGPPKGFEIEIEEFSGAENSVTVIIENKDRYEYSIDNTNIFIDNNIFTNLIQGYHTIYIRDKSGCGIASYNFLILDYPRFFTPNGDGYHDTWNIIGMDEFPQTKIYIYDRFGKLMKDITPSNSGWDGTNFAGNPMPSSDYWFTISLRDGRAYKGHFSLKR